MRRESIPAQSTCHMASIQLIHLEEGWKSCTHQQLEAAKIEWQVASILSANRQECENETAREHAKLSANQKASTLIRQSQKWCGDSALSQTGACHL